MTPPRPSRAAPCLRGLVGVGLLALGGLLLAVVVGVVAGVASASPAAAAEGGSEPLSVRIDTLTPGAVPAKGRVTVTGVVTNDSDETWQDLRVYLFAGAQPITTRADLAAAARSERGSETGARIVSPGLFDTVGDLGPGESTGYRLSVRRADLGIGSTPGVYWLGVHVLGGQDGARDSVADGRTRTFLPLVPPALARQGADTRLALVVPLRDDVRRGAAGRLLRLPGWQQSLDADGRLDRVLRLSGQTQRPLTWLVDPAVLDAAASVAADNPKLNTGSTRDDSEQGGSDGSSTPSPSDQSSPSSSDGSDGDVGSSAKLSPEAQAAGRWLEELRRQGAQHTVLGLPYADLDVASALGRSANSPELGVDGIFGTATGLTTSTLPSYGVQDARPVVAPASGVLPRAALRRVPADTSVLLGDRAYPDHDPATGPVVRREDRPSVTLADEAAAAGGPQPGERYDALSVRQRILADSALHALSDDSGQPLVVSLPARWDPGERWQEADFFGGLDQPWLTQVDLPSVVAGAPQSTGSAGALSYPRADARARVPLANLRASREVGAVGGVFARLLTDNDTVDDQVRRAALLGTSLAARGNPTLSRAQTQAIGSYVRSQMGQVHVEGPDFVMMSSERGGISMTLVNDLEERVTVGVTAVARGPGLRLSPPRTITLAPGARSAVRIEASADDIGVHAVTVYAADSAGQPIGSLTQVSVRTSQVGAVIWVILAVGGVVLLLAIAFRLYRRVRRRRRTHGPLLPRDDRPDAGGHAEPPPVTDVADPSGPHQRPDQPRDRHPGREIDA